MAPVSEHTAKEAWAPGFGTSIVFSFNSRLLCWRAGKNKVAQRESEDPRSSVPFYLRPSEAEIHYPHLAEKSSEKPEII